jgi:uncharacterized membrane protein
MSGRADRRERAMTAFVGYAGALAAFAIIDMIWLAVMSERLYRPTLGDLLAETVNLPAAIAFYLIFPIGLTIFAVTPALRGGSATTAALCGGLLGFFAYATYDLSNQATLRNWTTQLTLIDVAWGAALSALAATAGYLAASRYAG